MAFRIFLRNNIIIIDNGIIEAEGFAKDVLFVRLTNSSTEFFAKNMNNFSPSIPLPIAEIQNEAGTPFGSVQSFIDWYSINTGGGEISEAEKLQINHSNRSILDLITEAFTTTLKNAYDSTVTWISTNGSDLINHLSNTTNPHNTTKAQVGLGNVDNTSDANKPTSTLTQTALNAKEPVITATSTTDFYRGDKTFQPLNKSAIGLNNVDNTSDANKPVSSAQATAIGLKEDTTNKSTLISESASTTKFPVWSAIVSYFSNSQILSILGISTLSGSNTGDETTSSIQTKRPLKTLNFISLEGVGNVPIPIYTPPTVVTLATAQASTSNVLANITGMSGIVVPFGGVYEYELIGAFSAVATTTGFNLNANLISGAGTSKGSIKSEVSTSSIASANPLMDGDVFNLLTSSTFNSNILGTSSTAGNNYIYMKIVINTLLATSDGTLNFQFASEVNGSGVSLLAGTTLLKK